MLLAGDLVGQWLADDLKSSVADQAVVTEWSDSVSAISANAVGSPQFIADAIGGRGAVRFDAADGRDAIRIASSVSPVRDAADFSVMVAFVTSSQNLVGGEGKWFESSGLVDANNLGFGKDWGMTINAEGKVAAGLGAGFLAPPVSIYSSAGGLNDGQLHTAMLTRSGGTISLYVDGTLSASANNANADPRSPVDVFFGSTASGEKNFSGDLAEVRFYDGQLSASEVANVQSQVTSYYNNSPPVAQPDGYTFPEDAGFFEGVVTAANGVLKNDTDADGDPLTAVLVETAQHGTLTLSADGSFFYQPDPDFFGTDQFTYSAFDFRLSEPVRVTIEVSPRYDAPVAIAEQFKMLSGTVLDVDAASGLLANDLNPDQVALTVEVDRAVSDGQLTLRPDGSFTYDPQGFAGTTSFSYRINDGTGVSNSVDIVLIVNTPPEARDDSYTLNEDTPLLTTPGTGVVANDVEAEGDVVTVTLIDGPSHGNLVIVEDGSFTYTPDANYFGPDQFTYQTSDGEDSSGIATVSLQVTAVNDAPEAAQDTYFTLEGETLTVSAARGVLANDSDVEQDALTAILDQGPAVGSVTFNADGSFVFTPPPAFTGVASFTYLANDGQTSSAPQTVQVAINSLEQQQQIVINEVHVDPDITTELVEFIELHNRGTVPISLAGWTLRNAVDFNFPESASIDPGGYLVVTENPTMFSNKFGRPALGPWEGRLSNDGETIELWAPGGNLIDEVDYQLGFPWPTYGETPGPSIQLINPSLANDVGGSWRGAIPTPGEQNSVYATNAAPQMRQVEHSPLQPSSNQAVTITAKVTDPDGVQSVELAYQLVNPGDYIGLADARYSTEWTTVAMADNGQNGDAAAGDGIYTVVLPADLQTHRRLVRYRVTSTDTLGASLTAPYEDDPQPNFAYFVYDGIPSWTGAARPGQTDPVTYESDLLESVPVYHLITTHENHVDSQYISDSELRGGYSGSEYRWGGTMVYNGEVYDHINFRARGGVWRYAMGKNMWKFDFQRGHSFQAEDERGQEYKTQWDKLNFSAIIQQGDYRHRGEQGLFEGVGFELFNLAGTEAPETHYVHFRIVSGADENGDDQYSGDFQGLYLAIEQPDGNFLDEHDLPDGNLYKIEGNNPESTSNQGAYLVDDASDVRAFLREFVPSSARPEVEWWQDNLDLEKYYGYQTISHGIHHYDTAFGKNFYYFYNPDSDRWEIHPWDLDLTWANNMYGNENHEFNLKVAKNREFNDYVNQANIDLSNRLNKYYQNRAREILDLLYNPEQTGMLIDQVASAVYQPGEVSLVDADRAMWDYNPINATNSRYTNNSKNATQYHFYDQVPSKDFAGMIKLMKDYIVDRTNFIQSRILTNEDNIPNTPTLTYSGAVEFALNGLTFTSSPFSSPIGAEFASMEWRIAEVTDPNAPDFNPYDRNLERMYEINAAWESGELAEFSDTVTIPSYPLEAGKTYRVRVRMMDNDEHWSHWSDPIQFVASAAVEPNLSESLRITEVNYNPHDPSIAEQDAGIIDNNEFEFLELMNIGNQVIDLSAVSLDQVEIDGSTEGVNFQFADGMITQLAPGQRLIVVENLEAFEIRYGTDFPVAGQWSGRLGNSSETLTLSAFGTIIQQFTYDDGWHESTDGEGATLEIINPNGPLEDWNVATGWRASNVMGGTPGGGDVQDIPGDANRDGIFNSADLVQIFQRGEYEDAIPGNSTWEDGDWNGDGDFTTSDLVAAFTYGAYVAAATPVQRELSAESGAIGAALDRDDQPILDGTSSARSGERSLLAFEYELRPKELDLLAAVDSVFEMDFPAADDAGDADNLGAADNVAEEFEFEFLGG